MKTQFINELNNLIKLEIKNYKDKKNFIGVKIILEGPNSVSENEITYLEAVKINNMLSTFLKKKKTINKVIKSNKTKKIINIK